MLDEKAVELLTERLISRIEKQNSYFLNKIGESVKAISTLSPSEAQQLAQILKYGGNYNEIIKELSKITNLNIKDIDDIFKEVAKTNQSFAKQFYNFKNVDFIPFDKNEALKRQVQALANITKQELFNISNTGVIGYHVKDNLGNIIFQDISTTYRNIIDEAVLNVAQGKESFDSAMYKKLKELGQSGLRYVDYANGTTRRLDSAIRMNMQGALRNLSNELQEQFGNEYGADGIEVSVHLNPAPDHAEVQGRQFSKEEFEKFQNDIDARDFTGKLFPAEFEGRDRRSISEHNCYHYIFSIVLGVNAPNYNNEQLQKIIDDNNKGFELDGKHYTNYEGTQLQRKIESEIRTQKDLQILGKSSGNDRLTQESQLKINQLNDKYKELSKKSGLPTKMERLRVSGYQRIGITKKQTGFDISKLKENQIFISAKENEMLADYYINQWYQEIEVEKDYFYKNRFGEKYEKLVKQKREGFKDEIITLDSFEKCEELLERVNARLDGDEIRKMDLRLVADASKTIYNNVRRCPAWLKESSVNFTHLNARSTNSIAETWLGNITLNNHKYKDYNTLLELEKEQIEIHEYADRTFHSWHTQVKEGNETRLPVMHETGHNIQQQISSYYDNTIKGRQERINILPNVKVDEYGFTKRRDIEKELMEEPIRRLMAKENITRKEVIDKYVSMYGMTNHEEMFAEMFANSQLGASNPLGDELINFLKEIGQWQE